MVQTFEHPPPDPAKLLTLWMEWERGEVSPGRVIANLKTAGMRELLEALAATSAAAAGAPSTETPTLDSRPAEPATTEG